MSYQAPQGKGVIVIRKNGWGAHIVAYENQLVYDGAFPGVISWDAWYDMKIIKEKWSIIEITPFDPSAKGDEANAKT